MKQDLEETKGYYEAQLKHGQFQDLGGSTDLVFVVDLLEPHKAELGKIIDLGCGDGSVAEAILAKLGRIESYIGVEPVRELAKAARHKNPCILVLEADVRRLDCILGAGLDAVLCLFLLQDMCDGEGTGLLHWFSNVLREDGFLLMGLTVASGGSRVDPHYRSKMMLDKSAHKLANTWGKPEIEAEFEKLGYDVKATREKKNRSGLRELYWLLRRARDPRP